MRRAPLSTRCTFKQLSMLNGVGINCSCVAMCTRRCVHRTIKRPCEARYTKPAALEASAAHKCCIKCKAFVGTSAVHKCCAHARTCTAFLFAQIIMKFFYFFLPFIFLSFTFSLFTFSCLYYNMEEWLIKARDMNNRNSTCIKSNEECVRIPRC